MRDDIVFMFSGQGSQYLNMGREFYESLPRYRRQILELDEIPRQLLGVSIVDILYSNNSRAPERFDNILHTHPALFMVQYTVAQCLMREGIKPGYLLGCSLGEWVALSVSGAVDPHDALAVLIKQAILFSEQCVPGGMIAVLENPSSLNSSSVNTSALNPNEWPPKDCELAAINFSSHFCISGTPSALESAASQLEKRGVIFDYIPVKQPFHSSLIDPLRTEFINIVEQIPIGEPLIPIISAMSAGPLTDFTSEDIWRMVRDRSPPRVGDIYPWNLWLPFLQLPNNPSICR